MLELTVISLMPLLNSASLGSDLVSWKLYGSFVKGSMLQSDHWMKSDQNFLLFGFIILPRSVLTGTLTVNSKRHLARMERWWTWSIDSRLYLHQSQVKDRAGSWDTQRQSYWIKPQNDWTAECWTNWTQRNFENNQCSCIVTSRYTD